jgi:dienelactone hydrolase
MAVLIILVGPPVLIGEALRDTEGIAEDQVSESMSTESRTTDIFDYDKTADFAVANVKVDSRGDAQIRDLAFQSVPGDKFGRVAAFLVEPREKARAAVLWVHWLGHPSTSNRTEFLDEAVELASRGAVSLLIDAMWAKPEWYRHRVLEQDYADGVAQVAVLRRALDYLQQQSSVRELPLAIVGHDYGGMYATIAAAHEPRTRACVFIACTPSLLDWAFFVQKPASMDAYVQQNARLDLRTHLASIANASILFQFAEHDKYVPLSKAQEFFAAAPNPKHMIVYGGAGHDMMRPASIRSDRTAWLVHELGLQ